MTLERVIFGLVLLNFKSERNKPKSKRISVRSVNKKKPASICSLTRLLISRAIEKAKETTKKEKEKESKATYLEKERLIIFNGGYGTVSRVYGTPPPVKYVDYDKLFSHLGTFRTYGLYGKVEEEKATIRQMVESTKEMVSTETIEKAAKHFKYFVAGEMINNVGYVPPFGMGISSKEWEKYRLMTMMSIYQPLIKLKSATA
jgi:hypothetical protein